MTDYQRVKSWMEGVGQDTPENYTIPDLKILKLRVDLIKEELVELIQALDGALDNTVSISPKKEEDVWKYELPSQNYYNGLTDENFKKIIVGVADALGDIKVVTEGAGVAFGIPLDKVFDEVMTSNDSKLIDGFMNPDTGKWMKGPSYVQPNLQKVLFGE